MFSFLIYVHCPYMEISTENKQECHWWLTRSLYILSPQVSEVNRVCVVHTTLQFKAPFTLWSFLCADPYPLSVHNQDLQELMPTCRDCPSLLHWLGPWERQGPSSSMRSLSMKMTCMTHGQVRSYIDWDLVMSLPFINPAVFGIPQKKIRDF